MFNSLKQQGTFTLIKFLNQRSAIESSEVAIIMAAVVVVVYSAFQLLGVKISEVVNFVAGAI